MRYHRFILLACMLTLTLPTAAQDEDALRREEADDYYEKWLNQDVVYIVSEEERAVFEALSTLEEKEQFIEQFWFRRDPDPRTPENEFKTEHYRRIAYANERFASGYPGWKTDRGRIYIIHGPPAEIESHASGGYQERSLREGGGSTNTFPYEIWRYRHIEGIGEDILLEFVDPSLAGEYRLALHPEEKDALLHVPGAGLTLAEQMGLANKADRPFFSPGNRESYPMMMQTSKDNPFYKYEVYTMVQTPGTIRYQDLKELVQVDVSYSSLSLEVHEDYFHLNSEQVLVPVTIQVDNKELSFNSQNGVNVAQVAVYGVVTSLSNRLITEFEHDLITTFSDDRLSVGLQARSVYQKVLLLERKQRYKLDLVVKDTAGEKVGVVRKAIIPPSHSQEDLAASSVILADTIQLLSEAADPDEMFVIGDVKIRPKVERTFHVGAPIAVYFQLYNVALDQSTGEPSLKVQYSLVNEKGEVVRQTTDESGESIQYSSQDRVVLVKVLAADRVQPGKYSLRIHAVDQLDGEELTLEESLILEAPRQMASERY